MTNPQKESNAMKKTITTPRSDATAMVEAAWQTVGDSFERFCLTAGIATLASMMEDDTERLCGPRHGRSEKRGGHRWGRTIGRLDFHGGTIPVERPRVRGHGGEIPLRVPLALAQFIRHNHV